MGIIRTVAINSGILFFCKLMLYAAAFFVSIFTVRYLGAAGFGKLSLVLAYISFFQIITAFGIDAIIIKEISKDKAKQNIFLINGIFLKLLFSIIAIILSWVIIQFMGYPKDIKNYIYIASLAMVFSFGTIYVDVYQSHHKAEYYAIPELVISIIYYLGILAIIYLKCSIIYFVILQAVQIIPLTIIYIYYSKRITGLQLIYQLDFNIIRYLLKESWPLFVASILIMINMRVDQILIFKLVDVQSLGLYSSAVKMTESLNLIPLVLMTTVFPLLSSSYGSSAEKFKKIYNLSFRYVSIIIVPIALATTLLSERFLSLIYGTNFIQASGALSLLMWSNVFVFLGVVNANILNAAGFQRYLLYFTMVGSVTNLLLNLFLIPLWGISGAALASLISYSDGLILQYIINDTRDLVNDLLNSTIKPILCSVPMGIFIYCFSSLNIFLIIIISILIYLFFLIIARGITEADMLYLKEIRSSRRS